MSQSLKNRLQLGLYFLQFQGHKLTIHQANSNRACLELCKSEQNCTWISFDAKEKLCITYSTCPVINNALEDFTSSEILCVERAPKFSKHCKLA